MAGTAILVRKIRLIILLILLFLMPGRLIGKLHVLIHAGTVMRVLCARLCDAWLRNMAASAHKLHRNRSSQRIAAEQRQPNG